MLRLLADWAERGGHDLPDLEVRRPPSRTLSPAHRRKDREVTPYASAALAGHQLRYDLMAFSRNGQARFFTLALPVALLLIFATVFRDKTVPLPGGVIHTSVYYVPGIIALGIPGGGQQSGHLRHRQRENGILKRRRATPVSAGC